MPALAVLKAPAQRVRAHRHQSRSSLTMDGMNILLEMRRIGRGWSR